MEKPRLLNFRALVSFHAMYNVFIAQCLETGNCVTADSQEMVIEMMQEIIEDEIRYAVDNKNLRNLLSSPMKIEEFVRWTSAKAQTAIQHEWFQKTLDGREFSFAIQFAFENCQSFKTSPQPEQSLKAKV